MIPEYTSNAIYNALTDMQGVGFELLPEYITLLIVEIWELVVHTMI